MRPLVLIFFSVLLCVGCNRNEADSEVLQKPDSSVMVYVINESEENVQLMNVSILGENLFTKPFLIKKDAAILLDCGADFNWGKSAELVVVYKRGNEVLSRNFAIPAKWRGTFFEAEVKLLPDYKKTATIFSEANPSGK